MVGHLLQVCNVGNICGGTAACAWTITRALPMFRHTVACFSEFTEETRRAFSDCRLLTVSRLDDALLRELDVDFVILHNTAGDRVGRVSLAPTLLYQHSQGRRTAADMTVACSRWLAEQVDGSPAVLYQPVPLPPCREENQRDRLGDSLIIGRICSPQAKKWPVSLIPFYETLASRFPEVQWEFVGAPAALQSALMTACGGRAEFWPAGWEARRHLWRWQALLYHHPTLTESFGRTCAEALRAGCIPLVDNRGGFAEQIVSGVNGFLCSSTDEFAAAIDQLCSPARRWELSGDARSAGIERFSPASFARQFGTLLRLLSPLL